MIGQGPGAGAAPAFAAQQSQGGGAAPRAPAAAAGGRSIRNIDFRRGADGAGQIVVELNDPRTTVDVRQEGGRIVVDFQDTTLPQELLRRLDVTDFATPVFTVDALRANQDARLVVTAAAEYDQVAYQSDNQFTLELKPPVQQAAASPGVFDEDREYTGERLTLNFQDLETRAVLQLIADFSGLNIVVSDTVQGSVTLRLQNVPWDQALDIVMTTKGLDMRRNGNVIIVAPAEEIAAREQAELESLQALRSLGAAALRVHPGQLREGGRARDAHSRRRHELAAVGARQRGDRRAHEHAARQRHGRELEQRAPARHARSTFPFARC